MMSSKNVIRTIVYLLATVHFVSSLNILGIFPYPGKSHFFVYRVYLQELARRGHSVTVISHFPETEPIPNYQDVSLAGSIKILEDDFPFDKSYITLLYTGIYLVTTGRENCRAMLGNKGVQELISKKPKFDVVVVEQFNSDCALGIAYKLGAPVIGINSHILMPWHYSRFGVPQNPAFVPFHFLDGGSKPSLFQKIEVTVFDLYFKALYYLYEQRGDENTLAQYFDDIPPLETLARDIKLLLLYHNFVLTGSRLFPANVIEVGGYHVAKAKPLPKDLQKFMDEAEHGVIYISFGSVIKSSTMPADKLKAVLETMKSLPQRFIWKWESKTLLLDKNKLYVSSWLPQVDILGHPKTLAFLSHAGMGGTTESLHYGVPIVAMPMLGDQPSNAAAIEESGLGVRIQAEKLSKENLLAAFQKVLHPSFRENVKRLAAAWHDRPLPPLQSAVYWTEFAARHHNLTFRTPSADLPFYQYYNLDVILVYAVIILITVAILRKIVSLMCRKRIPSPEQKSKASKKSKKNN